MALTVDEALEKVGSFGRYQLILLIFCNVAEWFWGGWPMLVITFTTAEPPWRCVDNSAVCNLNGSFYPGDDNYEDRCNMSREHWEFTDDFTSVVTKFDLVCDKAVLASLSSSVIFAGGLVSVLVMSSLSDKFGRKTLLFSSGTLIAVGSLASALSFNYWMFVAMRMVIGVGIGGCCLFVYVTEFVAPRHRSMMGTSLWYSWTLSLIALAGVAYLARDWVVLSLIVGIPTFLILLGYLSVRWLTVKGKTSEAEQVLRSIAHVNRRPEPEEPLVEVNTTKANKQRLGDFRDLFATRALTHYTLLSWYCWFVVSMVYYGVFFSAPSVGGDMYLNFFLTSLVELPAIPLGIWAYNKFGRKRSVVVTLILAAISSACAVIIQQYGGSGNAALGGRILFSMILAKFFIMIAYDGMYVYSAELFPTVIRNIGIGICSTAESLGSFCSSYVVYTARVHPLLPYGIMGINALIAGFVCMTGPETFNKPTEEVLGRAKFTAIGDESEEGAQIEIQAEAIDQKF